jgi:hypothetical protein
MIRNHLALSSYVVLAAMNSSCAYELRGSVKPESPDSFIVYYHPWDRLIDEYGPGTENVRAKLKADGYANAKQVWADAIEEAIPQFLEAKNMTPLQCKSGVVVVRSGEAEGGNGWARFRCR